MATKDTKKAAAPAKGNGDFKFGVNDLADIMDIAPASVRVQLRNKGVDPQNGNKYGWKTKDDLKAMADKLRSSKPVEKKAKVKAAGTEKPKAKPVAKAKAKAVPKRKAA